MSTLNRNIRQHQFQAVLWVFLFVTNFVSNLQYDPTLKALAFAMLALLFYAAIIYGNTYWLIPGFYRGRKFIIYTCAVLALLAVAALLRSIAAVYIMNLFSAAHTRKLTAEMLSYSALGAVGIYFFSVMYRLALDYFELSTKQEQIKAENASTELHLLKQQVHPHFLFNTLNNIYYVAQKDSPEAAELIERLSGIIRYFMEESKKNVVSLQNEIELLTSYIELESIRMRYEMLVNFQIEGQIESVTIPPLLLLPLVENIFKHGVDKRSRNNFATITLVIGHGRLIFTTLNGLFHEPQVDGSNKTGLFNLEKRLALYYGNDYKLITETREDSYISSFQIPIYEN